MLTLKSILCPVDFSQESQNALRWAVALAARHQSQLTGFADGLSMAAGNYLSIRSHEGVLEAQDLPEEEADPFRHAAAPFLAFVVAGAVPLTPYLIPVLPLSRLGSSFVLTLLAMFAVSASRALITMHWWKAGLEMSGLGAVVAALA